VISAPKSAIWSLTGTQFTTTTESANSGINVGASKGRGFTAANTVTGIESTLKPIALRA
jgi:hypothetical protein